MLDLRRIRDRPEEVAERLGLRGVEEPLTRVRELLELDEVRRGGIGEADDLRARKNDVSREIGRRKREGEDAARSIEEMREVSARISDLDDEVARSEERIREILLETPNLPLDEVPPGGEEANEVLEEWGERPSFSFAPRAHWDIGEELGILDLERGAKISGSGFPVLRGRGARLQRALIDLMLDLHVDEHGYEELRVPYLVTTEALTGTGQLPKFADESYWTERDDLWLIPTAEVPVTNLHRDEILPPDAIPVRYTAYSPCFRREAGAAGKDTRGLLRVHQFDKVELVRYERPQASRDALDDLVREATEVIRRLGLAHRIVRIAAGDLGFSSALTLDVEIWAPGVERWLEVSSASTFTDFQARRANLRFRPAEGEKPEFVHTLNASGVALPRLMVALLETYQLEDGSVVVPEVLRERLGAELLEPVRRVGARG